MADGVELHVLVPGAVPPPRRGGPTVRVELTDGTTLPVPIPTDSLQAAAQVDELYRLGGRRAVTDLRQLLARAGQEEAAAWCFQHDLALRPQVVRGLRAVDGAGRLDLATCLDQVRAQLALHRYGLVEGTRLDEPPVARAGEAIYRRLREDLAALDPLRRAVLAWTFTIPPNAPTARAQFEGVRLRYVDAFAAAVAAWPVLSVVGASFLADLGTRSPTEVRAWAAASSSTSRLDQILRGAVAGAAREAAEHRPTLEDDVAREGGDALQWAERSAGADQPSVFPPEKMVGLRHPLWRYPFLVHGALETLGHRPGSVEYAAVTSALVYAEEAEAARREDRERTARVLGWASLGFGLLGLVPVVGLLATAAAVTVSTLVTIDHAFSHVAAHQRAAALGPAAARFGYADPDGLGLVAEVLGTAADLLPFCGPALVRLARTAGVVVRARAVEVAFEAAGQVSALAGTAAEIAAAAAERDAARIGLDRASR